MEWCLLMRDLNTVYKELLSELSLALEKPDLKMTDVFKELETKYHLSQKEFSDFYRFERFTIMPFPYPYALVVTDIFKSDEKYLEYIKNRFNDAKNPAAQAVYRELLFGFNNDHRMLYDAGIYYITHLKSLVEQEKFQRACWILLRISSIANRTNSQEIMEQACSIVTSKVKKIFELDNFNIGFRIREALMSVPHLLPDVCTAKIIHETEILFDKIENENPQHIESSIPLYIDFLRYNKRDQELTINTKRYFRILKNLGDYFLEKSEGLLATHYFQKAMKVASDFGFIDEFNSLKTMILQANRKIKWSYFEASEKINKDDLIKEFKQEANKLYGSQNEPYLSFLSIQHNNIPSLQALLKEIEEQTEQGIGVIQQTLPTMTFSDEYPRGIIDPDSQEGKNYFSRERLVFWTEVHEHHFSIIVSGLIEEGLTADRVFDFLFNKRFKLNSDDYSFVKDGLIHYFDGLYSSAIHLLLPQIERIVRNLILQKYPHVSTHTVGRSGIEIYQKLLAIISSDEGKELLGERFCEFVTVNLTHPKHRNIRNRFLHGFAEPNECTSSVAWLLIWILLMISEIISSSRKDE